jgi:hypothetical protein
VQEIAALEFPNFAIRYAIGDARVETGAVKVNEPVEQIFQFKRQFCLVFAALPLLAEYSLGKRD